MCDSEPEVGLKVLYHHILGSTSTFKNIFSIVDSDQSIIVNDFKRRICRNLVENWLKFRQRYNLTKIHGSHHTFN